jgi:Secretion system C-terminal sorting domain
LRVITSQTIDFVTIVGAGTLLQVNYEYFGGGIKSPVFSISTSTAITTLGTFTQTLVTRYKAPANPPNAIPETEGAAYVYHAFPNPAKDFMLVSTNNTEASVVSVSDITGKEIGNFALVNGSYKIDLSAFNNGIYLYTVKSVGGKHLRTGKILIID